MQRCDVGIQVIRDAVVEKGMCFFIVLYFYKENYFKYRYRIFIKYNSLLVLL